MGDVRGQIGHPYVLQWRWLLAMERRPLTKEELARCNGQDGASALHACQGRIYDVSQSFHWKGGRRHAMHCAGEDLTVSLSLAPHAVELLERVPMPGKLSSD
jgi:predicted heme/steroid binding protein